MRLRTILVSAFAIGGGALFGAGACSSFDASPEDASDGGGAGSDGPSSDGPSAEASVDADAGTVVPPVDGGACNLAAKWGAAVKVPDVSSNVDELGAWRVGTDIFFGRGQGTNYHVYRGRTTDAGTFESVELTFFNGGSYPGREPAFDETGLWIAYQTLDLQSVPKVFVWARKSLDSSDFPTGGYEARPTATAEAVNAVRFGAGAIWYSRAPSAAGDYDLYRATFHSTDGGSDPGLPVAVVNGSGTNEKYPVVTGDGLRIYFASDRDKATLSTGYDVFTASRKDQSSSFGTPTHVAELDTSFDDFPAWVSPNGCEMLMTRSTADGTHDIYAMSKPKD